MGGKGLFGLIVGKLIEWVIGLTTLVFGIQVRKFNVRYDGGASRMSIFKQSPERHDRRRGKYDPTEILLSWTRGRRFSALFVVPVDHQDNGVTDDGGAWKGGAFNQSHVLADWRREKYNPTEILSSWTRGRRFSALFVVSVDHPDKGCER